MDPALSQFVVRPSDSLEDALALIEENGHRTVIVVDERDVVVGTLSDGDARKAILDHRLLATPVQNVMNTNFISVTEAHRDEARELFDREHIFLIPVLAEDGRLFDIARAYE